MNCNIYLNSNSTVFIQSGQLTNNMRIAKLMADKLRVVKGVKGDHFRPCKSNMEFKYQDHQSAT